MVREILYFQPQGRGTDIVGRARLCQSCDPPAGCLVPDLRFPIRWESRADALTALRRAIRLANKRHDLVALHIQDRREHDLPDVGILALEDAETGEVLELDTADPQVRTRFAQIAGEQVGGACAARSTAEAVDSLELETGASYVPPLMHFFKSRTRRSR